MSACSNCGLPGYAKGRCRSCFSYWYRTGRERPEHLYLSAARRRLERELMRRAWGPLAQAISGGGVDIEPPTTVYLLYGESDVLLYVGISRNIGQRLRVHSESAPWWGEVVRAEYHHVPTRSMAQRTERAMIWRLKPKHNIQHRGGPCPVCEMAPVSQKGRCHTCHNYFVRHGVDRPPHLIERSLARYVEEKVPARTPIQIAAAIS